MVDARAVAFARMLLLVLAIVFLFFVAAPLIYPLPPGAHVARDFVSFWAASKLALHGQALAVYNTAAHAAVQSALYATPPNDHEAFFYPPLYLLICLPLALLPAIASAVIWLGATTALYWAALRRLLPGLPGRDATILAYPAVFLNALYGQNGCLTAGLFGFGVAWLEARPILAGCCFGLLAGKPQLGLAIPVALAAAGRWRVFAAAASMVAAQAVLATCGFGSAIWAGWWRQAVQGRVALDAGAMGFDKMASVFAAIRLLGGGIAPAYAMQAGCMVASCVVLVWLVRRRPGAWLEGAAMVASVPFCTPFLLDYDLVLLAIPMAVLFTTAWRRGFLPGEKALLALLFLAPLLLKVLTARFALPVWPLATLLVLGLVARRIRAETVLA